MLTLRRLPPAFIAACALLALAAPSASAALRSPRLVSTCPKGSAYGEQARGAFRLEGCLETTSTEWRAVSTRAELSGLDVDLLSGTEISLSRTGTTRLKSSGKAGVALRVKGGSINTKLYQGPLDLVAPGSLDFDLDAGAAKLLGLDVEGDQNDELSYSMSSSGTDVELNLGFPGVLGGATFAADLSVEDGDGLKLNSLSLGSGQGTVPFSGFPGVFLRDVRFNFTAPSTIVLGGKLVLPAVIPQSFGGTLSLNSAGFESFSGSVAGANLPIFPPAPYFLQGGTVNVSANPISFGGTITTSFGQVDEVTGSFIAKSTGGFQFVGGSPSRLKLTGTTQLFGLGNLSPASGTNSVTLSSDGVLDIDSTNTLNLRDPTAGGLTGTANVDGSFSSGGFRVGGSMTGAFDIFGVQLASATGSFKANGKGYGACLTGSAFGFSTTGQARADWGDDPALDFGCNLSRFATRSFSRSVARATPPGGAFTLGAGATNAAVRVRGGAGAPGFDLRLPDGTVLAVRDPKPTASAVGGRAVARATAADTTTLYLTDPPAGAYAVDDAAGPLAGVTVADDAPPAVKATVGGDGESRTLAWTAGDLDGGKLQIADVQGDGSSNVLVVTDQRTGKLDVKVPFGPAGPRTLVATVTGADGIPRADVTAGGYAAPKPFTPSPPRDIGVSYSRKSKQLTFSQVQPRDPDRRPDFWYYKVALADGRLLYLQGAGTQKVKVRDVPDDTGFRVSVFGIENEGLQGKARTEKGTA
jgi:hypothetical protein